MTKSSSIWIAVLTFTAVILAAILLAGIDRPAQASMLNSQSSKVTMITTGNGGDEGLIIVDRTQQKVIIYLLKGNELTPIAGANLLR
jgi:hypothetical protein